VRKDIHGENGMHVFAQYQCFVPGEETDQQNGDEEGADRVKLPDELA